MIDGPISQVVFGLVSALGLIILTYIGSKTRNGNTPLPAYLRRAVNLENTEPVDSFDDLVNKKVSKATEELTNTVNDLKDESEAQRRTFTRKEIELEGRISNLEKSLQQKDILLQEKDKSLEESRSVNSIMADNAKSMTDRMTKIENALEELRTKYNEKVEALSEREKLISELETQLRIQQTSIDLLKDLGSKPVVIHLITGDKETTHIEDGKKEDTKSVSDEKPEVNGG